MKSLSLCMIVKNEEENLDCCLSNANQYADEIIIVDTGSTDKTKEIAKKYTKNIYDFKWVYDFSKARNFSFDKAKSEYIMWLDADDIVLQQSVNEIKKWKRQDSNEDVLMCNYVTNYEKDYKPIFQYSRERIIKNKPNLRWQDPVHECIVPIGNVVYNENIKIYHHKVNKTYTDRNLNIYLKMIKDNVKFSPRQQFYYARELYYNNRIDDAIHEFSKFISERKGWVINNIEACLNLSKCYQIKKEYDNALSALFGSFIYSVPSGEILYEIGCIFLNQGKYDNAIFWFKLALQSEMNVKSGAFINEDCYRFLPAIQLCLCYYKKGDVIQSYHYHLVSKGFKPNDERVIFNDAFFKDLKDKEVIK